MINMKWLIKSFDKPTGYCLSKVGVVFTTPGHYDVDQDEIIISQTHISRAFSVGDYVPVWTFSISNDRRIKFHFTQFSTYYGSSSYHEYVEIGDGMETGLETRLAHFAGRTLPSNVTSVSNSAWLKVYFYYTALTAKTQSIRRDMFILLFCKYTD